MSDKAKLLKPFPASQITVVNKGHGPMDTVNHAVVTSRLIDAAGDWTYTIDESFTHGKNFWVRITLTIDGVSRPEYGEGQDPKKALSDAIKRAAMRFGVALDLWAKAPLDDYDLGESTDGYQAVRAADAETLSSAPTTSRRSSPSTPSTPEGRDEGNHPDSGVDATVGAGAPLLAEPVGEGRIDEGDPGSDPYLNAEEAKELTRALGGPKAALALARARYGERIRQMRDLTRSMALELISERVG